MSDDGLDSRPIRIVNSAHHVGVWLLAGVVVAAGAAYVTRDDAPSGCTYTTSLMDRGTRLAAAAGSAIHSLDGPVPTAQISDTVRGTWQTLGFWGGTFGAAVQGRTAPTKAPMPCGTPCPAPQGQDTPGGQQPWDPKNDSLTTNVQAAVAGKSEFSAEQVAIASAAARVAQQRGLPQQALVIILAAGFQESGVRNLNYGDRDSLGWLQQRASWGSVAERRDPATAAGKFFDHLGRVSGWQQMSVTRAAQAVQISQYPNAYAQWEDDARKLAGVVGTPDGITPQTTPPRSPTASTGCSGNPDAVVTTWNSLGCYAGKHCNSDGNVVRGFEAIAQTATVISGQELPSEARRAKVRTALPGFQMTSDGTAVPIMWNTSKYDLIRQGKTEAMTASEGGPKWIVYVELRDHVTGTQFAVVNTHIKVHPTEAQYARQVNRLTGLTDKLQAAGDSVIVTGDFNSQGDAHMLMGVHGLTNSFELLGRLATHGNRAIDDVWALGATPSSQRVLPAFGSDHRPHEVTFVGYTDSPGADSTPASGVTPDGFNMPGNRTVDEAVTYMETLAQRQTRIPTGTCLHVVAVAYGHHSTAPYNGHYYATGVFYGMPAQYKHADRSTPPRGALVFWKTGNPAGHIALSLGGGKIVSTDFNTKTQRYQAGVVGIADIASLDRWGPRLGWTLPYFTGRTRVGANA